MQFRIGDYVCVGSSLTWGWVGRVEEIRQNGFYAVGGKRTLRPEESLRPATPDELADMTPQVGDALYHPKADILGVLRDVGVWPEFQRSGWRLATVEERRRAEDPQTDVVPQADSVHDLGGKPAAPAAPAPVCRYKVGDYVVRARATASGPAGQVARRRVVCGRAGPGARRDPLRGGAPLGGSAMRPVALIIGPYRDATEDDERLLLDVVRSLADAGWAPVWYPPCLAPALNDRRPAQRAAALACSAALVSALARSRHLAAAFVVRPEGGEYSSGMLRDLDAWAAAGGQAALVIPWERVTSDLRPTVVALRGLRERLEQSVIGWPAPGGTGPRGGS